MRAPRAQAAIISQAEQDAWYGLFHAHNILRARIEPILLERHRLSFSSFEVLCRLKDLEPQAVRALAGDLVTVSPSRASRLVQELVDAGYLQRGADQDDGRVSLLSLTRDGRAHVDAAVRTFEAAIKQFFVDPLDADDIAALVRVWRKLESPMPPSPGPKASRAGR
jgi:DNA-binding MarR family transcriptional regulator